MFKIIKAHMYDLTSFIYALCSIYEFFWKNDDAAGFAALAVAAVCILIADHERKQ